MLQHPTIHLQHGHQANLFHPHTKYYGWLEQDADTFIAGYQHDQEELAAKITQASSLLPQVDINDELLETVAKLAVELGVDGHRADITVIKTALTLAAFNGRKEVELEDVKNAAKLVLPDRKSVV